MKSNLIAFALVTSVFASACRGLSQQPAAAPTSQPTAPPLTATPISPTATAAPTPAPQVESNSSVPQVLYEAMIKTRDAKSYLIKVVFASKGEVLNVSGSLPEDKEIVLTESSTKVSGQNSASQMGGSMVNMPNFPDSKTSVEQLTLDGKTYIKGPDTMRGAPEAIWYIVPEDQNKKYLIKLAITVGDMFKGTTAESDDLKRYGAPVAEEMDGQTCQVYKSDQQGRLKIGGTGYANAFSEIEIAESRIAVCADGYIHEMSTVYGGKLKIQPSKSGYIRTSFRLSDFGAAFEFEAPKDPAPLQAPSSLLTTTRTPEAGETTGSGLTDQSTDFPKPDDYKIVFENSGTLAIETGLSLKDVIAFYREKLGAQGLKEKKAITIESDTFFRLTMEGLPDGKAVVVEGVKINAKKTQITVRAAAV